MLLKSGTARAALREWSPRDLSNKWAWYRRGRGITGAVNVSSWGDAFNLGHDLLQATGVNQPLLQSDGSILFDGVAHYLKTFGATLIQPSSIVLFVRQITWMSGEVACDGNALQTGYIQQINATPQFRGYAGTALGNVSLPVNTYGMLSVVFNGALSSIGVNNDTRITGNAGSANMNGFTLGSTAGGTFPANIQAKEGVILSGVLTSSEIAKLYAYGKRTGLV